VVDMPVQTAILVVQNSNGSSNLNASPNFDI
jgi:hypothetical protein